MKSYPGTTMIIQEETPEGLILEATIENGTPITTEGIFAVGASVVDLSTGITYKNNGTTASPSWQNADEIETSEIADAAVTPAKSNIVQARTATADGLTTAIISDTATFVQVTSASADNIIVLPTPTVGRQVVINVGANGYELRSSAPATVAINGGTGVNAESAIAANSTVIAICVSATAWKAFFLDADSDLAKVEAAA